MKGQGLKTLAIIMVLIVNGIASAASFVAYDIKYEVIDEENNKVEVQRLNSDSYYSGNITVPEKIEISGKTYTVISIGDRAFYHCSKLKSISLPQTLEKIGFEAFDNCSALPSISIPDKVKYIGWAAFYGCIGLSSLSLPTSLEAIEDHAFYGCKGLTGSLVIPESVTSIGKQAFRDCGGLTGSLVIPEGVTTIGERAFQDCAGFKDIFIPSSVSSIGDLAFAYCGVFDNVMFEAVRCESAGRAEAPVFNGCRIGLLSIGSKVASIPDYMFKSANVQTVVSANATPPEIGIETFTSAPMASLHVPSNGLAAYWVAPSWQNFKNIKAYEIAQKVAITPNPLNLALNSIVKLDVAMTPQNATFSTVVWESSNPQVATVDDQGNVLGKATGVATITAYTVDGSNLKASCVVAVGIQLVESITLSKTSVKMDVYEQIEIAYTVLPESVSNNAVTWTTSNPNVAVVRQSGEGNALVLAVADGVATITATATDGSGASASCVVTVGTGGIDGVEADNAAIEVGRYDLYGRRLSQPAQGVNIIKMSDGSIRKEVVK